MTRSLGIQLTELCAPGCLVCGPRERPRSLPPDTFERALLEGRALGIARVVLTGGEPLLHEEINDLVDQAVAIGVEVELVTTGHRIEQRQPALERLGDRLKRVWVEFHGGTAATHERTTGRPGSFQEARAVLEIASELKIPTGARLVATPASVRESDAWRAAVARFSPELAVDRSTSHLPPSARTLADAAARCADRDGTIVAVVAASGRVYPCFASLGAGAIPESSAPLLEERLKGLLEQLAKAPTADRCSGCAAASR